MGGLPKNSVWRNLGMVEQLLDMRLSGISLAEMSSGLNIHKSTICDRMDALRISYKTKTFYGWPEDMKYRSRRYFEAISEDRRRMNRPPGKDYVHTSSIIPKWVPADLTADFMYLCRMYGQEQAASTIRAMKREAALA